MSVLRFTLLLVVALLSAVTSQPFSHPETSKRSGFEWNSRKIGNRKVATISIRRDEERDRRSVALADDDEDDDPFSRGPLPQHHHHHRHQQAESTVGEGGQHHHNHHHNKQQQQHLHRHHHGDDDEVVELIEGLSPHLRDLTLARLRSLTTAKPKGNAKTKRERKGNGGRGGRGKKKQGKKQGKKGRRSSNNNKRKHKKRKVCRGLKDAKTKKKCKKELKKCRKMPRAAKKECKARVDSMYRDMFNFIQSKINMSGNEACQYQRLELCCRQADLPPQDPTTLKPVVKCHFREKFLECMQDQMADTCDPTFHTQGNMTALRNRIRQVVWSNSSCLISEALEG